MSLPIQRPCALVLDEDPEFLLECRGYLEEDGLECLTTQSASEAHALMGSRSVDLLVCDVAMPAPGGLALIESARRAPRPPAILPLAGLVPTDSVAEALRAGGWSVLFKPLDVPRFSRTVAWCLQAHRAARLQPVQLEALYRISAVAGTESNLERILEQVLELLIGVVGADTGSIMLEVDAPGPRRLSVATSFGLKQTSTSKRGDFGAVSGWVAREMRPLRLVGSLDDYPQFRGLKSNGAIAESLVAPIVFRGQCIGVVSLSSRTADKLYPQAMSLLIAAADTLGAVIHRERRDRAQEHQDRLALLGRLAASLAHELQNPLTHLKATLPFVWEEGLEGRSPPQEVREAFSEMVDSVDRMVDLVGHLRSTSRKSSHKGERVDPNQLVMKARALVLPQIKHRVELEFEPGSVSPIHGEPNRILQIIINLIINAAQAIEAERHDGRIRLRTREESGKLLLTVEDNGSGIPPEVAAHLFQPFFTTKGEREGTGLGLSISRQIAREHGGELSFASVPGEATTFTLALPVMLEEQRRPRILVVDDEPMLLNAIRRLLTSSFEVLTAESPEEAQSLIEAGEPELMIVDFSLRGSTGLELVQAVRTQGRTFPVAVLTGAPNEPELLAAREAGAIQSILAKPWNGAYLVGQALGLIGKSRGDQV